MSTTGQADVHARRTDQLARKEKGYKMANTLNGWLSQPCHQSRLL